MLDSTDKSIPNDMHYPKQCSVAGEGKPIKDPIFDDDGVISCHERSRFHHLKCNLDAPSGHLRCYCSLSLRTS